MKRNLAVVLSTLLVLAIIQMSSLRLRSNDVQPPQPGVAGDPGQTTCNNCHVGSTLTEASKFTLKFSPDSAGLVGSGDIITGSTQYIRDSTQWVSIQVNGTNGPNTKYGFQLTALDSAGNMAGAFTLTNTANTSMQFSSFTGRHYVGHKNAISGPNVWSFKWKAPHSGNVTFYYACNIANGDGTDLGDSVFQSNATISAGSYYTGISELPSNIASISAYPIPMSHQLHVDMDLERSTPLTITLMTLDGRVIREFYDGQATEGKFTGIYEPGDIAAGVYLLNVRSGSSVRVIKVIKL